MGEKNNNNYKSNVDQRPTQVQTDRPTGDSPALPDGQSAHASVSSSQSSLWQIMSLHPHSNGVLHTVTLAKTVTPPHPHSNGVLTLLH